MVTQHFKPVWPAARGASAAGRFTEGGLMSITEAARGHVDAASVTERRRTHSVPTVAAWKGVFGKSDHSGRQQHGKAADGQDRHAGQHPRFWRGRDRL